ncbi:MAG: hydantoinase/oxoprolinase family protein [Acidobacteria bacterium]|nr:MAG: hydantoinase/oxoprolinase family protein [Acidobacteriota bacterium]
MSSGRIRRVRVGVDTGGTFTDFVIIVQGRLHHFKIPSTPHDPAEAVLAGLERIGQMWPGAEMEIVHGSTVATNALLERKGARTALITTAGFEDVLEIGRQARPRLYDVMVERRPPLVPARLRFGARERIGPRGDVIVALGDDEVHRLAAAVARSRVESVAICLLFSFANPEHERRLERAMTRLGVAVSASHRILPEYREYERTSTVVINAYVMPLVSRYVKRLLHGIARWQRRGANARTKRAARQLRIMQSSGGSISAQRAAIEPVRTILSGPAGGVVGALAIAEKRATRRIMTFDMGGTSTDVALCIGEAPTTQEARIAELPIAIPVIDIHTVGAGGGSIAHIDAGGALRVGPESAGADPGPVCYGRGEQVTVTDANLILGRFGGRALLGGEMPLDVDRATLYMDRFAEQLSRASGRPVRREHAALGIISVANANMERALRKISIERGYDPRDFTLVCFGGAGGLHVCALAEALRINRIIVPMSPGTLSALGMLLADVHKDYSQTVMLPGDELRSARLERAFRRLEARGLRELTAEGFDPRKVKVERSCTVRYQGQSFELEVPWSDHLLDDFHRAHQLRYGYADPRRPTEIVSARVRCIGRVTKPRFTAAPTVIDRAPVPRSAWVFLAGRFQRLPVYDRDQLPVGYRLQGPAIIAEYSSTTFIPPGFRLDIDAFGNMIIHREGDVISKRTRLSSSGKRSSQKRRA